eukprot:g14795.t1
MAAATSSSPSRGSVLQSVSDYIRQQNQRIRNQLSRLCEEPTELQLSCLTYRYVKGLHQLLEAKDMPDSSGSSSCAAPSASSCWTSGASSMSIRRHVRNAFSGLYDFDRNRLLNHDDEDRAHADDKGAIGGAELKAEAPGRRSADLREAVAEVDDADSQHEGACSSCPEEQEDSDNASSESESSGSDFQHPTAKRQRTGAGSNSKQRSRYTVAQLLFILQKLERMFCAGHEVLRRLAAEDVHAAVRKGIPELLKTPATSSTTGAMKSWSRNLLKNKGGGNRYEIVVLGRLVHVESRVEEDHHLVKWKFSVAGGAAGGSENFAENDCSSKNSSTNQWEHGEALHWVWDFPYKR